MTGDAAAAAGDRVRSSEVLPASPGVAWLLLAIGQLLLFDLVALTRGFKGIYARLENSGVKCTAAADADAGILRAKAAVAHACLYYPKSAACLQRSWTLVRLLRRVGVQAELVIGVQALPFRSHAWAEYKGIVLNDGQTAKDVYLPIDRR